MYRWGLPFPDAGLRVSAGNRDEHTLHVFFPFLIPNRSVLIINTILKTSCVKELSFDNAKVTYLFQI
jgi:hypothetical protein